jgi:valyl-tRNA synthetase
VPDNRRTEYFEWMRNIRDWCISRQLWWGHRIPAWYCDCGEIIVSRTTPAKCSKCGSSKLTQDPDVLETWFSSALWPFSTMGWPDDTPDYRKYYPTSLLITGYDILFFWVARMIMMGLKFTGNVPFRQVCLHSLVRNAEGQKMSKSKGTGIDPVELNEKFGTDAMRFTLASMAAPGTDIILSEDRILSYRNFANKIWNAARFVFMNLDKYEAAGGEKLEFLASPEIRDQAPYKVDSSVPPIHQGIFHKLADTIRLVNDALDHFRFHEAAHAIYHFFWDDFCDFYIESVKNDLNSQDTTKAVMTWRNLFAVLENSLRLLHPFMPFLTEELWQQLPQRNGSRSIALAPFPTSEASWISETIEPTIAQLQDAIRNANDVRAKFKIQSKNKLIAYTECSATVQQIIQLNQATYDRLARAHLELGPPPVGISPFTVRSQGTLRQSFVQEGSVSDFQPEIDKMIREMGQLSKDIQNKQRQLRDETFLRRAPEHIVKGLEATLADRQAEYAQRGEQLKQLELQAEFAKLREQNPGTAGKPSGST